MLYITVEEGKSARKWFEKWEQPYYVCKRRGNLPFLLIHCPVPEFYKGKKAWKEDRLKEQLRIVMGNVQPEDYVLNSSAERLLGISGKGDGLVPEYLLKCMLKKKRFSSVSIHLPQEGSPHDLDLLISLLTPYLPKTRTVTLIGGEEWFREEMEGFLYYEYGIVAQYGKKPEKGSLYMNLWNRHMGTYFSGDEVKAITYTEALKFLDTMVKNGYNTES